MMRPVWEAFIFRMLLHKVATTTETGRISFHDFIDNEHGLSSN